MDLNNLAIFKMTSQNMAYLSDRQKVLATNVANANTPNYLPKDVEKPSFSDELRASTARLRTTNEKHFAVAPSQMSGTGRVYTPKPTTALTMDGNGVDIEEQLNEVSKSKSEHNRMVTIYGKYRTMLKVANTKING